MNRIPFKNEISLYSRAKCSGVLLILLLPKCGSGAGAEASISGCIRLTTAPFAAAAMQVQVQVGGLTAVPSAAPVLMAPSGTEATLEPCAPTTPDACPLGTLSVTVARVEVALPPLPPLPPMPPTAPAVLVALVPALAPVVPVAPAPPIVLFNEILIVQEVAAPLSSNWQVTG